MWKEEIRMFLAEGRKLMALLTVFHHQPPLLRKYLSLKTTWVDIAAQQALMQLWECHHKSANCPPAPVPGTRSVDSIQQRVDPLAFGPQQTWCTGGIRG